MIQDVQDVTQPNTGKLVLVRHSESEWNALGKWTGWTDVSITEKGAQEARLIGETLRDLDIDLAYCSRQIRTCETLLHLLTGADKHHVPHHHVEHLNERDYGDYTGLNKWEVLERLGEETFNGIRRGWDHPVPNGETLKMVAARAVPFYQDHLVPKLNQGKTVLVVSHGNTLRSLIKHLEDISDEGVADVEMPLGSILIYDINPHGRMHQKQHRHIETSPSKA